MSETLASVTEVREGSTEVKLNRGRSELNEEERKEGPEAVCKGQCIGVWCPETQGLGLGCAELLDDTRLFFPKIYSRI